MERFLLVVAVFGLCLLAMRLAWKAGDVALDTGFRGDRPDDYPQWIDALAAMACVGTDIRGGTR